MSFRNNAPGNTYLSEEILRKVAKEKGRILSAVGQKPEVRALTIHGKEWEPKGK